MGRDTCKMTGCDREPGTQDCDSYNQRVFCSAQCEVKYDHIRMDAMDAQRHEERDRQQERRDLPEYDGPPY